MKEIESKYKCIPFWSWNDELDEKKLCEQIEWMHANGVGGFFMHARGGLKTEYLGEKWFSCVKACQKKAAELGMEAYAYDENGWPSGFVGGKLLEDEENHDGYLTTTQGKYDERAIASFSLDGEELTRVFGGENCLNVFSNVATSTADICNPKVVEKFIALTHEQYKKHDDGNLRGFFTDEPQYYRWGVSYTKMLKGYFAERYGYGLFDKIGLLFVKKKGYEKFRYQYWSAMQDLMLTNFAKKVYGWCDENGYKLTGHYIEESCLYMQMECNGGIMPFYEYEHIPGVDCLCRFVPTPLVAKQVGSVASQLGKPQVLTETFACCGWDVTPKELKKIAESQYVGGVNLMCQHLLPYSEHGQRKRDYPAHFSDINPWVKANFKEFNDYFSALGHVLATSKEIVTVGILHNIKSAYVNYDRYDASTIQDLEDSLQGALAKFSKLQIPFHLLDETVLKGHGSVEGKSLVCGLCKYDYIVLPKTLLIEKTTDELLRKYVANGGKILLLDGAPYLLEGEPHDFGYLRSNVTMEEIANSLPYKASANGNVRSAFREDENGNAFLYLVNVGDEAESITFDFKDYSSFKSYDILADRYKTVGKTVTLKESQSVLLYLSNDEVEPQKELKPLVFGDKFSVCEKVENNLTLDMVSCSTDGVTYGVKLYYLGLFDKLLQERYEGKLWLKYDFVVKDIPQKPKLIIERSGVSSVTVNGKVAKCLGESSLDKGMVEYDVANCLQTGKNEVVLLMNWHEDEKIYYALFGENVTEGLRHCIAYDSNVEPIYLKGDFGVDGKFEKGNAEGVLLGTDFEITEQKSEVTCLIKDGFPFFYGTVRLAQKVFVEDNNYKFVASGRYHLIGVFVNGKKVGNVTFGDELPLDEYLVAGENLVELEVTTSLRNAFGPFHTESQEDLVVSPGLFERHGEWKDGKTENFRESYSFVKDFI